MCFIPNFVTAAYKCHKDVSCILYIGIYSFSLSNYNTFLFFFFPCKFNFSASILIFIKIESYKIRYLSELNCFSKETVVNLPIPDMMTCCVHVIETFSFKSFKHQVQSFTLPDTMCQTFFWKSIFIWDEMLPWVQNLLYSRVRIKHRGTFINFWKMWRIFF